MKEKEAVNNGTNLLKAINFLHKILLESKQINKLSELLFVQNINSLSRFDYLYLRAGDPPDLWHNGKLG